MSGGMPELGSKISLISKADIRYEGRLYTVDPQECTIALSSVRSFGTEDRETQYQIAPQGQIYDYILFRGSDIKDIRVINNSLPHPNDPAIMQVQLPNGQHLMPHFSMPNMTAAQAPVMGTVSAYGGTFGTMGGLGGITSTAATGPVASLAPGAPAPYMLGNQQSAQQQQPKGVQSQSQQHTKQSSELKSHHDILIKSPQVQQEQLQSQQQQQQQPKQLQNEPILHSGMAMKPNPLQQVTTTRSPSAMNSSLFNSTVGSNALAGNNLTSSSLLTTVDCMSGLRGGGGVIVGGITTNTVVNNATKNHNIAHIGIGIGGNSTAMPIDANCGSRMIGVGMGELNLSAAGTTTTKKLGLLKDKDQDILAGASRSTTPISLISRKSPSTADVGANHQQQQNHQSQHANQQQQHLNQNNVGHGGQLRDGGVQKRQNHQQQSHQPQQRGNVNQRNKNDYYHQQSQQQHHQQQHNINNTNNNNRRDRRDNTGRTDFINHANANIGANINGIRSYNNRRGNTLTNNRSRWNDGYSWASKSTFKQTLLPRNNKNQIKFEQDFDFEQANNKFEELRSQLSKLKVGDEPKSSEQINGETDKKDDSGNETGAGEHEPEEDEITVGYDKTKSFFDNISCEAAQDRSKNKGHDWRQERKLNSETFGVSSTRRGGYRGHGNYYNNRNMGGYNVGAYNRGYRGGNSYRTRINNRNNLTHNRDTNAMGRNSTDTYSTNTTTTATTNNVNAIKNQTQQPQAQNQDGGSEVNVNGIAPSTSKSVAAAGLPENATQSPLMTTVNAGQ